MYQSPNVFSCPILFITYNKPDTTKKVFEKILSINPEHLIISSDGPSNDSENKIISNLRKYFDDRTINKNFLKLYQEKNIGCKENVIYSITKSFEKFDKLIIIEDDTLPSKSFFQYTQKLLNLYEREKKVNLISGYNYLSKSKHDGPFYFSKYTNIWGWATWKNRWENRVTLNEENLNKFKNSDLSKVFFSEQEASYFIERFEDVVFKQLDTWDYGLIFSNFFTKSVSIVPKYNLVKNIGLGHQNAAHTKSYFKYLIMTPNVRLSYLQSKRLKFKEISISIENDIKYHDKILIKKTFYNRFVYKLLKIFNLN